MGNLTRVEASQGQAPGNGGGSKANVSLADAS